MKRLGLIGGIGTLAGVQLVWRMVESCAHKGAWKDSDYPNFVYLNIPVHGTDALGSIPYYGDLVAGLVDLSELSCEFAMILCNTSHLEFNLLEDSFSGELLNMVQIACRQAKGRVAVLSSRTVSKTNLYGSYLLQNGCEQVVLTESQQAIIDGVIADGMGYRNMDKALKKVCELLCELQDAGADQVILGCTELSMIPSYPGGTLPVIDAGFVAIQEAVRLCQ